MFQQPPPERAEQQAEPRRAEWKLVRRKLLGTFVLAVVGAAGGWWLGLTEPWRANDDIIAGGLLGATLGGLLPGWRLGRLGWGIVFGIALGVMLGSKHASPKQPWPLEWAVLGYLLGFVGGLIAECTAHTAVDILDPSDLRGKGSDL